MKKEILIYFFYGKDDFRIAKEINRIKYSVLKKEQVDFNFDNLVSPSIDEFLDTSNVYPVLSERRVICIDDFDGYFLNNADLLNYLDSPSPTSIIIFYDRNLKINLNNKFFKKLKGKDYFKLSKIRPLYDNELFPYIKNLSKEKDIKISDESIYYIVRYTGNNTAIIDNELDKIASGIKPENRSKVLSVSELKPFLSFSKTFSIFDLIDKILDKDARRAFSIFSAIYDDGEKPIKIAPMLYNEIRKLHRAKLQESAGINMETILQVNSILPFLKNKFLRNLSLFSIRELKKMMELLEEVDIKLKTTAYPHNLIFEEFIFKLNLLDNPRNRCA